MDNIRDLAGYYKWVQRCKREFEELGEKFTTTKQRFADDWWHVHERTENRDVEPPPDIVERRQINDSLHKIDKKLDEIHKDTSRTGNIFKSFASAAKQFVKDLRE